MILLPIEDFSTDHPAWPEMLSLLGSGPARYMERKPLAPYGGCYWLSEEMAEKQQAEMDPGWRVHWVKDLYIEAVHHGVIRKGDAWLDPHDVQPGGLQRQPGRTLFVEDHTHPLDLRWPVLVENRFVVLNPDEDIAKLVLAYKVNNQAQCARRDARRAVLGTTWSIRGGWRGPGAQKSGFFDVQLEASHRQFGDLHAKLRDRYFPEQKEEAG